MAKQFVPIELDKTRNLRFGMVALMQLEKKLGKSFAKIDFGNDVRYEELAMILWAGLAHEDKTLTVDKVAELVDDYSDIKTVMAAMTEAIREAFGTGNEQEAAPQEQMNQ